MMSPDDTVTLIRQLLKGRRVTEASERARSLAAEHPNRVDVLEVLARSLSVTGDLVSAERAGRHAVTLAPDRAASWSVLAQVLAYANKASDALDAARRALDLDEGLAEGWRHLALALLITGRLDDARHAVDRAVRLDPGDPLNWLRLATVALRGNRCDQAEAAIDEAERLEGENTESLNLRGELFDKQGRHEDAQALFYRAVDLSEGVAAAESAALCVPLEARLENMMPIDDFIRSFSLLYGTAYFALRRRAIPPTLKAVTCRLVDVCASRENGFAMLGRAMGPPSEDVKPETKLHFLDAVMRITGDARVLDALLAYLGELTADPDIFLPQLNVAVDWLFSGRQDIQRRTFVTPVEGDAWLVRVWPLYQRVLAGMRSLVPEAPVEATPESGSVLVLMPMRGGHSEKDSIGQFVLHFAAMVARRLGTEVEAVCSSLRPMRSRAAIVAGHDHGSEARIEVHGVPVTVWSAPEAESVSERIASVVEMIVASRPRVIVAAGNWNVPADLLADRMPVVNIPLRSSQAFHQFSMAQTLLATYKHSADKTLSARVRSAERLPGQAGRFVSFRGFNALGTPAEGEASLPDTCPGGAFVYCVVGNRLLLDVDVAFVQVIEQVLAATENSVVLLVGVVDPYFVRRDMVEPDLRERVLALPYTPSLLAVLRQCGAMLNPFRAGGGHAALLAMSVGLPVVTRRDGDVAEWVGQATACDTVEGYVDRAVAVAQDPVLHAALGARNRQAAEKVMDDENALVDLEAVLEAALDGVCQQV